MKECKIQRTREDLYRDITTLAEIGIFNKEGIRKLANIIRFVQAFSDYPEKESKKPGENKIIKFQPLERLINDSQSLIPSAIEFPPKEEIKEKSFEYIPLDPNEPSEFDEPISTEEESASSLVGDNRIGIYLKDIERYKIPNDNEQKDLVRRIKTGDKKAREELINSSLRLVIHLAQEKRKKSNKKTLSLNDLIQEGSIGLIHAIERMDENRPTRISSYSGEYIKWHMKKAIDNKYRLIRIPSYLHYFLPKWKRAIRMLEAKNGQTPTTSDILDYLNNKEISNSLAL